MTDNQKDLIERAEKLAEEKSAVGFVIHGDNTAYIIRSLLERIAEQQAVIEKKDAALTEYDRMARQEGFYQSIAQKALAISSPTDALESWKRDAERYRWLRENWCNV